MKYTLLLLANIFAFTLFANTQPQNVPFKKQDSEHIKEIFEAWNKQMGNYVYESMAALVMHESQPERPSGIKKTPFELLQTMGTERVDRLRNAADVELQKEKGATRGKREAYFWQDWMSYLETTTCGLREGSSTGEPHMLTFDGERYDFQNAGDYLLSSSKDKRFMVQTQLFRRYSKDSWSLNGGVIMNVNGDIIELKGTKEPIDGEVYINNVLINQRNETINLPQGGTIRLNETPKNNRNRHVRGDRFIIKWPTGEEMRVAIIRNFSFGDKTENDGMNVLYQLYVEVPKCRDDYSGLLGNNDGIKNDLVVDDTSTINNDRSSYSDEELFGSQRRSPQVISRMEKSCDYIAHTFGDTQQLDSISSLFPERMTDLPDSVRYPSRCVTLADVSDEQIAEARRKSKEAGISRDEMYSTVFDNAYANIDPRDQVPGAGYIEPKDSDKDTGADLNKDKVKPEKTVDKKPEKTVEEKPKASPATKAETAPQRPKTQSRPSTRTNPNTQSSPGSSERTPTKPEGREKTGASPASTSGNSRGPTREPGGR